MSWICANNKHTPLSPDHFTLRANFLGWWTYLHDWF